MILDTKMVDKCYAPSQPGDMTVISKMAVILGSQRKSQSLKISHFSKTLSMSFRCTVIGDCLLKYLTAQRGFLLKIFWDKRASSNRNYTENTPGESIQIL